MAGDCVHVFGVPLKTLVWRRMMTHVFFWANHLGIYPAASASLSIHNRLDTAVANSTTNSNMICNILISVITDSSGFPRWPAPPGLCLYGLEWPQCDIIYSLSKSYLIILSKCLHCWQHRDSLILGLVRSITMSEPMVESILLLKTDCRASITCVSLTVEEKRGNQPHFLCHVIFLTPYY